MKGRKPKPTLLKLIQGNPGKRALNADEPVPPGALEKSPSWLTRRQKIAWNYAIENAPAGLLRRLDRSVLAVWVVAEDLHRQAVEEGRKFSLVGKTANGTLMPNPYISVANVQAKVMLKAAEQLGFTPSSRSRIHVEQPVSHAPSGWDAVEAG